MDEGGMTAVTYRAPTVDEAVAWLMQSRTLEYRRSCIKQWRTDVGESFADKVQAEFAKRFASRKRKAA